MYNLDHWTLMQLSKKYSNRMTKLNLNNAIKFKLLSKIIDWNLLGNLQERILNVKVDK